DLLLSRDAEGACLWETGGWKQKGAMTIPGDPSSGRYYGIPESMDEGASWEKGLYVKERDKRLELRDVKTDRLVRRLEGAEGLEPWPVFSASGDRLVARAEGFFQFFDVGTGKALSRLPRSNVLWLRPNSPALSPRGTYFAKNDEGARVELYEVRSGNLLRTLAPRPKPGKRSSVLRFHFSPDEQILFGEAHQQLAFQG